MFVAKAAKVTQINVYFCDAPLVQNRSLISKIVAKCLHFEAWKAILLYSEGKSYGV